MDKRIKRLPKLLAGLICLITGLLLWRNLTLHFAQIEEVLPQLRAVDLYRGKDLFIDLIVIAAGLAVLLAARLPWQRLLGGMGRPFRTPAAIVLMSLTFIPLFWLRFGGAAWLILILMGLAFFCSFVGLVEISSWFAVLLPNRKWAFPTIWNRLQPWLPAGLQ